MCCAASGSVVALVSVTTASHNFVVDFSCAHHGIDICAPLSSSGVRTVPTFDCDSVLACSVYCPGSNCSIGVVKYGKNVEGKFGEKVDEVVEIVLV